MMSKLKTDLIKAQKDYLKVDQRLIKALKRLQIHCRKTVAKLLKKHGYKDYWSFSSVSFDAGIKAKGWDIDEEGFWVWGEIEKEEMFLEILKQIAPEFYKITGIKIRATLPDDYDVRGYNQRDFLLPLRSKK